MVLELGAGDGRAAVRAARRTPTSLVIGVDTEPSALREPSRRAGRRPEKGGLPNVVFLAGDARTPPAVLDGWVDDLRVTLPWGSLLRAVVEPDTAFVGRVARLLRPGGTARFLLSATARDNEGLVVDERTMSRIGASWCREPLRPTGTRPATMEDVASLGSSWAKRLGIPCRRPAWVLVVERCGGHGSGRRDALGTAGTTASV